MAEGREHNLIGAPKRHPPVIEYEPAKRPLLHPRDTTLALHNSSKSTSR